MDNLGEYRPQALGILRIVTALLFIEHGTMKLFGFPSSGEGGGDGLSLLSLIAGILETFGGLAVLVGFMTRPVAFILSGQMAVAYWFFHFAGNSFFPVLNRGDAAILFCFVFLYLVFAGPGSWSLDEKRAGRA
ncbi:DoxX family protein [Amaricoccus sp. W119]|uniref:DoxX family protein n=1 Tax=Amaricoccus sp. W119 TaxID=3391833 RepID=UPI0039A6257A